MNIIYEVTNLKLWCYTNLFSIVRPHCIRCTYLSVRHKSEPCKKLNRLRCADSRPRWYVDGPIIFLYQGSTTELYATGFSAGHCTYQRFVRSVRIN